MGREHHDPPTHVRQYYSVPRRRCSARARCDSKAAIRVPTARASLLAPTLLPLPVTVAGRGRDAAPCPSCAGSDAEAEAEGPGGEDGSGAGLVTDTICGSRRKLNTALVTALPGSAAAASPDEGAKG